jgi:hypothetical protein
MFGRGWNHQVWWDFEAWMLNQVQHDGVADLMLNALVSRNVTQHGAPAAGGLSRCVIGSPPTPRAIDSLNPA